MSRVPNTGLDAANEAILPNGTTFYISLHTADPGTTGASESTEGRQPIVMAASSGGTQHNGATLIEWASAVGGTYPFFGIWTASSGGTYKRGGTMSGLSSVPAGAKMQVAGSTGISFTAA